MKKKIFLLILGLILIVSMFSGCSEATKQGEDIYNKMEDYAQEKDFQGLLETYGQDIYNTTMEIIDEQLKDE